MSVYKSCYICERALLAPWHLPTKLILEGLFLHRIECEYCSAINNCNKEDLIEELSERIRDK